MSESRVDSFEGSQVCDSMGVSSSVVTRVIGGGGCTGYDNDETRENLGVGDDLAQDEVSTHR